MGYNEDRGSSSAAAAVAAVLVVLLLVVFGLVVLGAGAWFVARARASQERALMQAEEATRAATLQRERARALAVEAVAERQLQAVTPGRKVTLQLDQEGNLRAEGQPVQLDELRAILQLTPEESDVALLLSVDDRCPFQHVARVLDVCREIGIQDIRFESLADADDSVGVAAETQEPEVE